MNCISHRLQPYRGTVNFIWAQLYTVVNNVHTSATSRVLVLRLQPIHRLILQLLGPLYENIYNPSG